MDGKSGVSTYKRRGKEEILAGILRSAMNGTTKTKIMYENALSFAQVKHYIEYALNSGFIMAREAGSGGTGDEGNGTAGKRGRFIYITTEKGVEYLRFYEALNTARTTRSAGKGSGRGDRA